MTDSTSPVVFEQRGQLGIARLNAEKSLNALSLEMIDALYPQLLAWQKDDNIKAVWLEGTGERAFCAGGDIVQLYRSMVETPEGERNHYAEAFFSHEYRLDYLIHQYGKPIVCWADGVVMGGGIGLMAGCSHRIVTPASRIAMPEITIGLYPDVGGSRFLSRTPGDIGLFLGLTGASINASDAHYVNLADHVVAQEKRETIKQALADTEFEPTSRQNDAKVSHLLRKHTLPLTDWPKEALRPRFDIINHLCDAETLPEVVAQICDYAGEDKWIQKAARTLQSGCPQSAWLVWIAQQYADCKSLADVFRMEWILSMQCAMHGDFQEGVRALLIDKDKTPNYRFTNVDDIPEAYLAEFLELPISEHPLADLGAE